MKGCCSGGNLNCQESLTDITHYGQVLGIGKWSAHVRWHIAKPDKFQAVLHLGTKKGRHPSIVKRGNRGILNLDLIIICWAWVKNFSVIWFIKHMPDRFIKRIESDQYHTLPSLPISSIVSRDIQANSWVMRCLQKKKRELLTNFRSLG